MGVVVPFPKGRPVVILAYSDDTPAPRKPFTDLAELRANISPGELDKIMKRAFRATGNSDPATAEIARATLRHIADLSDYPQVRSEARAYLRRAENPKPPGAA